ncbi:M50 family metallopeptidase [Luteimonas aestuarii]|uniref:M50 family metallopeptidase n=1 Tax=Luteimonas aestuarii TaxID=453837 RepID=UPI0014042925|nr:M50 family metallopeptidase [Luteimonas aestuarii]
MSPDAGDVAAPHAAFLPPPEPPAAKRKPGWRSLLVFVLWLVAGGVIGALAAWTGIGLHRLSGAWLPPVSAGIAVVAGLLMLWPHIVLHEAGHAVAGLARGMRPIAFGVGPLRWDRGESGWRFRRGNGIAGISGFAALLPVGERGLSRGDQALFLSGGPLANLLTAAVAFALAWVAADSRWLASVLFGTAAGALLLGLVNLLPFHSQGWRSDGRGLLDLLRGSPDAALQQRLNQVMALTMAGVRPRDWPDTLLPEPPPIASSPTPMLAANVHLLRLSWAMDRGDDATAAGSARQLTAAYHDLPVAFRPHLATALAGHAARNLRDAEVLAAWRPLCEGGITDLSFIRAWLDAELAVLTGAADAGAAIAAARALLPLAPDPVTMRLLGEYLDALSGRLPTHRAN